MELGETKSYKGKQNNIRKKLKINEDPYDSQQRKIRSLWSETEKTLRSMEDMETRSGIHRNFDQQLSKAEEKYLGIELWRRREKWGSASRDESSLLDGRGNIVILQVMEEEISVISSFWQIFRLQPYFNNF